MLFAGTAAELGDADLEGLTMVALSFSAKDTSTSTVQVYMRFASIAQATAGAASLQDPENFPGDLFANFGHVNLQVRQDRDRVVTRFEVPNDRVLEGLLGN